MSGSGIENSESFRLVGDYVVTWTATPDSDVGCYHGASLERVDGDVSLEYLTNEMLDGRATARGSTRLYGLDDTQWYVQANSGCDWSFTFTPS